MSTFGEREDGFEKKFAHDEELRFRAMSRRNRQLGLWAADKLGLTGADVTAYVEKIVKAEFSEAGDEDVFRLIRADFDKAGVDQSDHQIRRTMDEWLATAMQDIKTRG